MAKIMVVAGGDWQCPIIKTAKEMGHFVICSNLYKDSPAFAFSDAGEVADVLDRDANLAIAKKYMPDAVLTDQSDIAVPTVAYLAEKMGLKGIGMELALLYTNKYRMREFCRKHGIAHPKYQLCKTYHDALSFFQSQIKPGRKAILKPLDSQSSRGVHLIRSSGRIKEFFSDTMRYSNAANAVLIEQYIEGREFTVDGIRTLQSYETTAISKKEPFAHNQNIAKELLFSNNDAAYDYDCLRQLNEQLVLKTGLPFGLTHAEYKYMDGQFYLIEIAARGGGTKISSDIVPFMSGVDTNRSYIRMLLGLPAQVQIHTDKNKHALLGFFDLKPGIISSVSGAEQAAAVDGVKDLKLNFAAGDTILEAADDRSRAGHYIITADSYEKLREQEAKVKNLLKITYQE